MLDAELEKWMHRSMAALWTSDSMDAVARDMTRTESSDALSVSDSLLVCDGVRVCMYACLLVC
jgi:hypothetical protein